MDMTMEDFLTYKPVVGDELCIVKTTRIVRASVPSVITTKVDFVGAKYFTVDAYPDYKFHINGKDIHKDANVFPSNYKIYPSQEAYYEELEVVKLLDMIAVATTKACLDNDSAILKTPIDDLKKVCALLRINTTKAL